jgi:TusA-related sulfurtransferase
MKKIVDARGLSCPQPVMLANDAIRDGDFPIEVLVDTVTSRENVLRMAKSKGLQVESISDGDGFKLTITE